MVKVNWIDPNYANATISQYREENILGETCKAIEKPIPWRELNRKLKRCRRDQYYVRDTIIY
jgi:hypothetical protein